MSREYDADSVNSMNRSPPPTSPKASFLSNGGSPTDYDNNRRGDNNNSDNEEPFKPPSFLSTLQKQTRERYWGVTNGKFVKFFYKIQIFLVF